MSYKNGSTLKLESWGRAEMRNKLNVSLKDGK